MSQEKRHFDAMRRLAGTGVIPRDTGEAISFPNARVRDEVYARHRINSKDEGEARRGLKALQRSSEYKRFSPYKKRFF